MRIISGAFRGRGLVAPQGAVTRPTADRVRQALFDMLMHAPWAGRDALVGRPVLDAFAGSGALGLEALSRGASHATFLDRDRAAIAALRANVAGFHAEDRATILLADATRPPPGTPCALVFLDPPYHQSLVPQAVAALRRAGWIAGDTLLVAETGRDEDLPLSGEPLAERIHGAARLSIWRAAGE
ncbi:Ribosomal RNA small subunit methyltransferase D [Rhodovastum atsumiense]|uniref:16S rRNA (Guanine(966)-N(2))-methyltransferase RsmD n=1 Tax=Rhodovastum atsumiense TaxID=504468 RepID=A0A5M6IT99_9PROT|nr:16S rRNA (guanine(966)-N(2))-methyltransferase RsmD [Rhodovastum atsumiense]KAA5611492.1 16S rRNA (guanine(966)-N(2))-methyltransferase RsmD [Rhodovastum atsumiense]CAH2601188.1 Ribosomal RNA small subunit methyltransferase D [Rhodovastum atsumiense]